MSSRGVTRIRDIEDFDTLERNDAFASQFMGPQSAGPPPPQQDYTMDPNPHRYMNMNCIDIANHIHYCPICSRLYACDKRPYITAIVFLAVIVIILLRKVME